MALTPRHVWPPFDIEKNATTDKVFRLYKADGDEYALAAGDVIRFKLWEVDAADGATPALDLDSAAATANDSSVTIDSNGTDGSVAAQVTVRLAQGDTAGLDVGEYNWTLAHVDDSETTPIDAYKICGRGTINVIAAPGGDRGKT